MQQKNTKYLLLTLFCLSIVAAVPGKAYAQGVIEDADPDRWTHSIAAYLWGAGMKGTAGFGQIEAEVDQSFSDTWDNLDGALSLRYEAKKGKWGYFVDGMYIKLDPSVDTPAGTVNMDQKSLIAEAGGVYNFSPIVQGLFGVRYQSLDVDLGLPAGTRSNDEDWVDGILGIRLVPVLTQKWVVWLRGDVAVVGDSDSMWNVALGAGYRFTPRWSVLAFYRILSNDYENNDNGFLWDIEYKGAGLALGFTF